MGFQKASFQLWKASFISWVELRKGHFMPFSGLKWHDCQIFTTVAVRNIFCFGPNDNDKMSDDLWDGVKNVLWSNV